MLIDGVPCAILGLVVVSDLTGTGVPWLLGTDLAVSNKRVFLKHSAKGIAQMIQRCPFLYNHVHSANRVSVRWLKFMGFTIHKPEPHGMNNAMFHKFTMGD